MGNGASVESEFSPSLAWQRDHADDYFASVEWKKAHRDREAQFWDLVKAHPKLVDAAERAVEETMSVEQLASRTEERVRKIRETAKKNLRLLSGYTVKVHVQLIPTVRH